jgi:hypothetical protein
MRIVKLHNKEQQEFDEYLKQALDAAEVDTFAMETYMAGMSFPVVNEPPVPKKKNDTWKKGLLLFILLFLSYLGYYVLTGNDTGSVQKKEALTTSINDAASKPDVKAGVIENPERSVQTLNPQPGIVSTQPEIDAQKNITPKTRPGKQNHLKNTGASAAPFIYSGKDSANLPAIKITTEPLKELPAPQTKKATADSLYIIW